MAALFRPSSTSILRQITKVPATRTVFYSTKASPLAATIVRPVQKKEGPVSSQIAAFHASGKKEILKPLPPNDAAPLPPHNPTHGSYHWTFERLVAASLIPLTVAPFAAGSLSPVTDSILCAALVVHSHIGFQYRSPPPPPLSIFYSSQCLQYRSSRALIIDYLPAKRVPKTRAFCTWLLRAATLTVAVGLYEFETNDVGLTEAIKRIWKA
ncbi:CybS family protein [Rasamsonia emersonii CBS 393.64]|uniref:Succinate dehydrogenase [ubiquinone] cytochrome b small subunit n=1 Tax=Rasamsonia emersonii (strain ATCC 16479 / CBS 393.64 / IMI 116815) TaxID=1408163 RepID=A0A0F4YH08_RASE3|nr:CybS family protein [Rasamsonia emersonii CBS 393.64]KKA17542.1 CybS family protein [Rasamsonia emersonii CBS 393.64]